MTTKVKSILKRQASKSICGGLVFVATIVFFMIPHFSTLVHEVGHSMGSVLGIGIPGDIEVNWNTGAGRGGGGQLLHFSMMGGAYSIFFIIAFLLVRRLYIFGIPSAIIWVYWGVYMYIFQSTLPGGAYDFANGSGYITAGMIYTSAVVVTLNELLMLRARKRRKAKEAEAKAKAIKAAESALRAKARSLAGPTRSAPSQVGPRSPARTLASTKRPLPRP